MTKPKTKCWRREGHSFGANGKCIWCNVDSSMKQDFEDIIRRSLTGYVDPAWLGIVADRLVVRVREEQ